MVHQNFLATVTGNWAANEAQHLKLMFDTGMLTEHSQMAIARFEAAATMQDAAIREWALLSADDKNSLRTYEQSYPPVVTIVVIFLSMALDFVYILCKALHTYC
jgi:hypothetical protein